MSHCVLRAVVIVRAGDQREDVPSAKRATDERASGLERTAPKNTYKAQPHTRPCLRHRVQHLNKRQVCKSPLHQERQPKKSAELLSGAVHVPGS